MLGVDVSAVTRLGIPDGAASKHVDEITDAIAGFDRIGLVVSPWTGDFHCDHEVVGEAARLAVARTGSALLFGLFWAWHRRLPADLADERILRLELDGDAHHRRRCALDRHRSQFEPPVADHGAAPTSSLEPQLTANLARPLAWRAEFFVALRPFGIVVTGAQRRGTALTTGVPPVTAGASGVQT